MADQTPRDPHPGTARLAVVIPVTAGSMFFGALLDYALPLYFGALSQAAQARGGHYPADAWSVLWKYQQTVWIVGPFLAGLLARRYGERLVWSAALAGQAVIPLMLLAAPGPGILKLLAIGLGVTGSLTWIAGVSFVQMVAPDRKGLANGLMMASLGVGSLFGPLAGRALLYRDELGLPSEGGWGEVLLRLLAIKPLATTPQTADFNALFWLLAVSTLVCCLALGLWGQRRGLFESSPPSGWRQTVADLFRLARRPSFWALVLTLCVLGGPIFTAANQFLPYRAEDVGLKMGSEDHGWVWLQLLKTVMWIPGGLAVGLLAGRRAPGSAGAAMLAAFALTAFATGASSVAWQLFGAVALFEFVRQFMRWSHSGYLSEHMPVDVRATAIGCSITFAGLAGTCFSWMADEVWSPEAPGFRTGSQSAYPFIAASLLGLIGSVALFVFDRLRPIRAPEGNAAPAMAAESIEVTSQ